MAGANGPIPADVRRFIHRHISSVEQLELLCLLRRAPDQVWTPGAASGVLRTSPGSAELRLEGLAQQGLVAREDGGYVYGRRNAHDGIVGRVVECYAAYRPRIVSTIFEEPAGRLQDPHRR